MLDDLRKIPQEHYPYDMPTLAEVLVPASPVQRAFQNLEKNTLWTDNIDDLLKYGDRKTYQRLTELAIANVKIKDPDDPEPERVVVRTPKLLLRS